MDLSKVLAMAQQQRSIPGLLSMLRGGDPQVGGGRGGPAPGQGQGQGMGQLQMAQSAMDGDGRGGGPQDGQYGNAWDNPANWGPPPPVTGPGLQGSEMFQHGQDPNGKFWSMGDYMRQYQQKYGGVLPEVMDEQHNNTINSQMLANPGRPNEPGAYMMLGHHISPAKRYYDLHRPISDPPGQGSMHYAPQFGPGMFWSTTGELGYPGQLEPFATQWGVGGPGSG